MRVQHHGQLPQSTADPGFSGLSRSLLPLAEHTQPIRPLPCPVTWQSSVFLPVLEVVKGLLPLRHVEGSVCGEEVRGCKYSGEAGLVPFQSPKLPFSSEKLLRQSLSCCEGDREIVGEVLGKRNGPHFLLMDQGREDWKCPRASVMPYWPPWWASAAMGFNQTSVLALATLLHWLGLQVLPGEAQTSNLITCPEWRPLLEHSLDSACPVLWSLCLVLFPQTSLGPAYTFPRSL